MGCSWAGLLLDLGAFPLLLWRPTRAPTLLMTISFHLMNSHLFHIDVFPWMMIAGTVILFFPDWLPWFGGRERARSAGAVPVVPRPLTIRQRVTLALLGAYLTVQILVPLRHVAYEGDADWTEEGQTFAWRMLMTFKFALPPRFPVSYRREGRLVKEELPVPYPNDRNFWATHWMFRKVAIDPDMVLQYCHWRRDQLRRSGCDQIDIRAQVLVALNGREPQPLIDPDVNLANEPRRWITPYPWILPLNRDNLPRADGGAAIDK
jgi:hypothetical protein